MSCRLCFLIVVEVVVRGLRPNKSLQIIKTLRRNAGLSTFSSRPERMATSERFEPKFEFARKIDLFLATDFGRKT